MPIASIKASLANRGEAFAQIGVIRKGAPKVVKTNANGAKYETVGGDLSYFRFVFDENETEAARIIADLYGSEPNNIRVRLPLGEVWKVWEFWLEAYTAGAMIARIGEHPEIKDGCEYVCYQLDPKTGNKLVVNWRSTDTGEPVKYDGRPVHQYTTGKGLQLVYPKPVGRLSVIIPDLRRLVYLVVNTTSWNDCNNITRQLYALDTVQKMRGQSIAGVPLILRRRLDEVSTPGDGGRARRKKWLISLEVDLPWVDQHFKLTDSSAVPTLMQINKLPSQLPAPVETVDVSTLPSAVLSDDDDDQHVDESQATEQSAEQTHTDTVKASAEHPKPSSQVTRPIAPTKLKEFIGKKADQHAQAGSAANARQRNLACSQLEACFAGDMDSDIKRNSVQTYLFGVESFTQVNDAQVLALLDWLKPANDSGGNYSPDAMAAREAARVISEAN